MDTPTPPHSRWSIFTGRRGRQLREALTGYLMIAPAVTLIFLFGIFPVAFALYVSLHKWQLVQGPFRGLANYTNAIGNLTYVALFALGVGGLAGSGLILRQVFAEARGHAERPWLFAIPGGAFAGAVGAFFRWAFLQLPEVLGIANKIKGQARTRELFLSLLSEAFRAEMVYPAWQTFTRVGWAAVGLMALTAWLWRKPRAGGYTLRLGMAWLFLAMGAALLWVTFHEIGLAYAAARETGQDPAIWPQFLSVTGGALALLAGWRVWQSAARQDSQARFAARLFGGLALTVGAAALLFEIPAILAGGDPEMWQGLKVTVFFSLGTVPVQLTIALFLSILLFRKLRGSEIFRVVFFLPYVTPAVASAAVFKQLFSGRFASPANVVLGWLGIAPQAWVGEPKGIVTLIGSGLGVQVPAWAAGPSLALAVIILLSIWTFVGYNTVIYLAGLGNIPAELTEAAEIDGANSWQIFRQITFPLLSPTTYFLSLLAVIGTFKAFNTIWVMREGAALGTTDPFSVLIFTEFYTKTRYGYASALAFVLFAIILSLTVINNRVQGSRVFYG